LVLLKIACLPVHRFFLASFFYVTVKVLLARNRTGRIFPSVFLFVPSVRAVDNIFLCNSGKGDGGLMVIRFNDGDYLLSFG
jgi:hypothetical protein